MSVFGPRFSCSQLRTPNPPRNGAWEDSDLKRAGKSSSVMADGILCHFSVG
jgi:hypothetical protein